MDPNASLREIRALFERLDDCPGVGDVLATVEEIQERFDALDGRLSKGGMLPDAWQRAYSR